MKFMTFACKHTLPLFMALLFFLTFSQRVIIIIIALEWANVIWNWNYPFDCGIFTTLLSFYVRDEFGTKNSLKWTWFNWQKGIFISIFISQFFHSLQNGLCITKWVFFLRQNSKHLTGINVLGMKSQKELINAVSDDKQYICSIMPFLLLFCVNKLGSHIL